MRIIGLSLAFVAFFATGCSILPQPQDQPVYYFNLGSPGKQNILNVPVELASVDFVVCEKTQMSFREGDNSVRFDEFNRWSDLPSNLLRRRLIMTLSNINSSQKSALQQLGTLDVEILRFDFDLKNKTANVAASFVLRGGDGRKILGRTLIATESKARIETAAGYAVAMSAAVTEMTNRLVSKLNALSSPIASTKKPLKYDKK